MTLGLRHLGGVVQGFCLSFTMIARLSLVRGSVYGLLFASALLIPAKLPAQVLQNGSFETNTFVNPGWSGTTGLWETTAGTITGWSFTGGKRWFMQGDNGGSNYGAPSDGSFYLNITDAASTSMVATTTLTGLTPGNGYKVIFDASKRVGTTATDVLTAVVNSASPATLSIPANTLATPASGASYATRELGFTATSASHTLTLSGAHVGGNGFLVDHFRIEETIIPDLPPGTLADYNEVWTTPSTASWESMPLGNGETSLNVWAEANGDLRFYIGRSDAESESNQNIKLGGIRLKLTPNPLATGQPFNQTLDLTNGRILLTAGSPGAQTRLRVWVDANQSVIRVAGDSDAPVSVEASYELTWRTLNTATAIADTHQGDYVLNNGADAITWYHRNRASSVKTHLTAEGLTQSLATIADPLMNLTFGGKMSGTGLVRSTAQKLVSSSATTTIDLAIDIHSGVYPAAANWLDALDALTTSRLARDPATDFTAHQSWWSAFWNRSHLDLGGPPETRLISKYHSHQRFINACSTRGAYPTPFNGSTFTMDRPVGYPGYFGIGTTARNADYRDWGTLRIFWQNTRHIYWPMLATGDIDLTEQLSRFCHAILPVCRERAMVWENNPGMLMPEGTGLGGDSIFSKSLPAHLTEHRGGMTDMAILLGEIHDHTRDPAFFTDTYQPWADAVVTFFENKFPNRDSRGKMLFAPSAAVETYKNSTNPATEVGPMRRILSDLLRLDPGALTTGQRTRYQNLLAILPPPPIKTVLNQPMLGVYETGDAGRDMIETPSLYSVWPARQSGLGSPSLLAAGRRDQTTRMFTFDGTSGHSFESGGWLYTPTVAAQLNLPQQAKFLALRNFLDEVPDTIGNGGSTVPNNYPGKPRFHAFWESRFDYIPDQCHGGSTIHGLESMLVQSHGDKIHLFPAWPEDWDINFKVHAARNTTLEGVFSHGVLQSLTVTPASRAADVIDMSTAANRIRTLVGCITTDANHLLGLPATRDGLPALPAAMLSQVTGPWLAQYGTSLDGALSGPFTAAEWGGSMAKGNSIFLHVLNWPGETLSLPPLALGRQITGHQILTGGTAILAQSATGITIQLAAAHHDPIDTIIRLDLDGSAEALSWHQPYAGSLTTAAAATASAFSAGYEAANACDADRATSWRHGATTGTLTIPFGQTRTLGRIDVQFDNGTSFSGQNISVTLEAQSPAGAWSALWSGTSYNQILNRPLVPVQATAIRLTTNAAGVRQIDAFAAPAPYTRTDDEPTGNVRIDVPEFDVLFQESLSGSAGLEKTGDGTLSLIDSATHTGSTRILAGTLRLHPPLTAPYPASPAASMPRTSASQTARPFPSGTT